MRRVLLQQIRRDRVTLPIWILGTVLLIVAVGSAGVREYGDAEGRTTILSVALATPALLALRGIPNGDSLGSAVHFQSFAFLAVTIGLMNVFLATRHGRADEEKGRRELLLAAPVSRLTPPLATLVLAILANGVFAVLATLGYLAAGLPAEGSVLSSIALATTGLAFFGVGLLAGELAATTRAASGIGVVLVLVAYALRAAGDALGTPDVENLTLEPAWPSWLSPIVTARNANDWKCTADPRLSPFGMPRKESRAGVARATVRICVRPSASPYSFTTDAAETASNAAVPSTQMGRMMRSRRTCCRRTANIRRRPIRSRCGRRSGAGRVPRGSAEWP